MFLAAYFLTNLINRKPICIGLLSKKIEKNKGTYALDFLWGQPEWVDGMK